MMRTVCGDLLDLATKGAFDVIVHGCNCFHTMGAGIARVIAQRFPAALEADRQTPFGSAGKLGTLSVARVQPARHAFSIVNAYTQYRYDGPGPLLDYDALMRCFDTIAHRFPEARIGYPLIGAGLAGGDWSKIAPRIDTALATHDHTLVILPGTPIPRGPQ